MTKRYTEEECATLISIRDEQNKISRIISSFNQIETCCIKVSMKNGLIYSIEAHEFVLDFLKRIKDANEQEIASMGVECNVE